MIGIRRSLTSPRCRALSPAAQAARSLMAREKQMPPSASLVFLSCSLYREHSSLNNFAVRDEQASPVPALLRSLYHELWDHGSVHSIVGGYNMPKSSNQKLKLIYLMKILLERTDETHSITMPEIIEALAAYDISAERKSLYNDIESLRVYGLDVIGTREFDTSFFNVFM